MNPNFTFPFQPYAIQEKFMKELYYTIENKKLGIFESPTGTGKSLSICCSALQWLKDDNTKTICQLETEIKQLKQGLSDNTETKNDWLQEEYEKIQKNQTLLSLQSKLEKIRKQKELFNKMKLRVLTQKSNSNLNKTVHSYFNKIDKDIETSTENVLEDSDKEEDRDFILDDYEEKEHDESDNEIVEDNDKVNNTLKIYISSRTHSQLSQFVGEIKRTAFKEDIRLVTLASRQHYCINPEVNKLKNINLMNERCLDMQKSKSKSTSLGDEGKVLKKTKTKACTACPHYNQSNITKLKERMLIDIMDMEDLVKSGKELKACPYYASRMALDDSEVVLLSHAGIVSSGARSGVSLNLQNNILILDEAHGLTAALENAHSAPVSAKQLASVSKFLQFYINKYRAKLSSKNLLSLNQINFIIGKLMGTVRNNSGKSANHSDGTKILSIEDFVIKTEIDHMNLRPLVEFCRTTRLAPKLHGFSMRYNQQVLEGEIKNNHINKKSSFETFLSNISKKKVDNTIVEKIELNVKENHVQVPTEVSAGSGLYAILDFLEMLCDRSENGRVMVIKGNDTSGHLKYLLLNPAEHFLEIVNQCRSVIVAGGTMEPIGEFKALLTGNGDNEDRVNVFRCDHVVPDTNVLAICLSKGPSNAVLNFSYENRMSTELLNEVGRILKNISNLIPGGIVCFLPSYSYEETIYEHMKSTRVIELIGKRKSVFREPKSAADVDQVLQKYASAVKNKTGEQNGALLLSVVGGKLSEGLNFSDDLGRCVVVVGMPYPNVKSPELQEKMSYLNRTAGVNAGSVYYENLCMKAVNQCIGRAVRHANDYACVLLVDERYSRSQTTNALPSFVQKSLLSNCNFGQAIGSIGKFFSRHKSNAK